MKRRFNYTERKKINRTNVVIEIMKDNNGSYYFEIDFDFDELDLKKDATIYIEAYHGTGYMRFNYGTVGNIKKPVKTSLNDFGDVDNVLFRIKVVDESTFKGKILAVADGIRPIGEDNRNNDGSKSILPTQFDDDLGCKIWRLSYKLGRPCIVFNRQIPDIENRSRKDSEFFFLVYPSVVRDILNHMIFIDGISDPEDPVEEWHNDWIKFAKRYVTYLPDSFNTEEIDDKIEIKKWVDDVVNEFCNSKIDLWENIINGGS